MTPIAYHLYDHLRTLLRLQRTLATALQRAQGEAQRLAQIYALLYTTTDAALAVLRTLEPDGLAAVQRLVGEHRAGQEAG
jgi:hypothetical protein